MRSSLLVRVYASNSGSLSHTQRERCEVEQESQAALKTAEKDRTDWVNSFAHSVDTAGCLQLDA